MLPPLDPSIAVSQIPGLNDFHYQHCDVAKQEAFFTFRGHTYSIKIIFHNPTDIRNLQNENFKQIVIKTHSIFSNLKDGDGFDTLANSKKATITDKVSFETDPPGAQPKELEIPPNHAHLVSEFTTYIASIPITNPQQPPAPAPVPVPPGPPGPPDDVDDVDETNERYATWRENLVHSAKQFPMKAAKAVGTTLWSGGKWLFGLKP